MKKKKQPYNNKYLKKIVNLLSENRLEEAVIEFKRYIKNYPKDVSAYVYLANAYMRLGNFEEAEKILEKTVIRDKTSEKDKEYFLMFKIKLLCFQNRYQEAYDALIENVDMYDRNNWRYFGNLLFLKKKLRILDKKDYELAMSSYLYGQIFSYSEEAAIEHIKKHAPYANNDSNSKFLSDFPIRDIYFKIREVISSESKKTHSDDIISEYIFKYVANGHTYGKLVDYIMAIVIRDSNDIITMFPYENSERKPYIDITPIEKEESNPKIKRLSQIEKFNLRYSKN